MTRLSRTERFAYSALLVAAALAATCSHCTPLRAQSLPMQMGSVTIMMPPFMFGTLIHWWRSGSSGCAFGYVHADTLVIKALRELGSCAGALGMITTSPPVADEDQPRHQAYVQWVLAGRPDLLFYWVVHDTMTVRGMLVPRIFGVRRTRLPVAGS